MSISVSGAYNVPRFLWKNIRFLWTTEKKLTVTGVTGVDGMDGKEVEISLESGKLVVRGEGLTVSKLDTDTGNLTVTAQNISSLVYGDKNKAGKGLARLFR